ncbi:MAG: hypothetical protein HW403_238 [Dehalococcoidia bacterium]|nr:hypothetical protein [Dehalococcoidia bacterium]
MKFTTTRYPIWNLWIARPLESCGYTFTPVDDYDNAVRTLLASPEDFQTVIATKETPEGAQDETALLWDSGRRIDDLMVLFSLAQGRNIHYREAHWKIMDGEKVVSSGVNYNYMGRALAQGDRAITPFEIYWFLERAIPIATQPGWAADNGFTPAVFWYLDSLTQSVVELRYMTAWMGVQSLASRHAQKTGLSASNGGADMIEALTSFRDDNQMPYISDQLIEFCIELANDFTSRASEDRFFTHRLAYIYTRKLQLTLEMTLLEMLGAGGFARRDSVLRDIRR